MGAHRVGHRLRSELDEGIRDLRKGHATETGDALAIIGSNAWVGPDGTTVVEPTGRAIHEVGRQRAARPTLDCILEIFLVLKCGPWATDVLGG